MDGKSALVRTRAVLKALITRLFKGLESGNVDILSISEKISLKLDEICVLDEKIALCYFLDDEANAEVTLGLEHELDNQSEYFFEIKTKLTPYLIVGEVKNENVASSISNQNHDLKLPNLNCCTFSGEGSLNLEYSTFLTQFKNIVGNRPNLSHSTKFTHLKTICVVRTESC